VLVPARGGPHARLAVRTAAALVTHRDAELALLHVLQQDLSERERVREERPFTALLEEVRLHKTTETIWTVSRSISDAILQQSKEYDILLLGAPALGPGEEFSLGRVATAILERSDAAVIVVKTATPAEPAIRALLQNPALDHDLTTEALSLVVDKWFAENTFNAEEYNDLERLVHLKRQRGTTISLGLPTLNEEATIGEVITTLKGALLDDVPLLDEIVVIDSSSTDRTREIARSLGVPVMVHQEILPEAGEPLHGKGEALWKSLHVLKGDIIAWVDTDVTNMHPRFVYGLIGPLLQEPHLAYVKGYYHRPIKIGDKLEHEGGGRVTELTVRPLFNLFFPMLSGFVQPLAGEYAGRREVLEQLPFFSGYGVETGLLIDLLEQYGLSAMGQVNLGQRIHRNQNLANLSLMAFSLVQVILSRLEEQARVNLIEDVNRSMKLIRFTPDQLSLEVRQLSDVERPPIRTVPAYRRARASAQSQIQRTALATA
jgi:glucosyl-3-phosphoglycerate synthase